MISLPDTYSKTHGHTMYQIFRDNEVAIYEEDSKQYYEVFEIKIQQAHEIEIRGKKYNLKHMELIPSTEVFGKYAYAPIKKDRAFELKDIIKQRISCRKNKC